MVSPAASLVNQSSLDSQLHPRLSPFRISPWRLYHMGMAEGECHSWAKLENTESEEQDLWNAEERRKRRKAGHRKNKAHSPWRHGDTEESGNRKRARPACAPSPMHQEQKRAEGDEDHKLFGAKRQKSKTKKKKNPLRYWTGGGAFGYRALL